MHNMQMERKNHKDQNFLVPWYYGMSVSSSMELEFDVKYSNDSAIDQEYDVPFA